MPHCVALGCTASGHAHLRPLDVSFHLFPANRNKRAMWVERVRRKDFQPSNKSTVCSRHFEEDCFLPSTDLGLKRRLRADAVPTIFDYYKETRSKKVLLDDYYPFHEGPAVCLCGFQADDLRELETHAEQERCQVYRCNCCGFVTHVRSLLIYHKRTKRFGCEYCEFNSETQGQVVAHTSSEHKGSKRKSNPAYTGATFTVIDDRKKKKMPCPYCKDIYPSLAKLTRHMDEKHNFGCDQCTYKTKRMRLLRGHIKMKHAGVGGVRPKKPMTLLLKREETNVIDVSIVRNNDSSQMEDGIAKLDARSNVAADVGIEIVEDDEYEEEVPSKSSETKASNSSTDSCNDDNLDIEDNSIDFSENPTNEAECAKAKVDKPSETTTSVSSSNPEMSAPEKMTAVEETSSSSEVACDFSSSAAKDCPTSLNDMPILESEMDVKPLLLFGDDMEDVEEVADL